MITDLTHELVEHGFTRVLVVEMAKQRSSMHLDTVFTMVDHDTAVVYRPLLEPGGRVYVAMAVLGVVGFLLLWGREEAPEEALSIAEEGAAEAVSGHAGCEPSGFRGACR